MKIQKKCSSYMKYTNSSTSFLARIPAVIFLLVFLFCMAVLLITQYAQDEDSGQQSADAAPSLAALLLGDYTDDKKETPLVLAATHIADAFVMALKQIAIDGDSQQMLRFSTCIDKVIEVIAGTKHMPKFLLLLSSTGKDTPLKKMPLKEETNKLILKAAASTALSLSEQAAIIGICKGEDLNSMLLKRALEAPWTYQKVKCEILKEYLPSDTKEKVKSNSKALDSKREQEEAV